MPKFIEVPTDDFIRTTQDAENFHRVMHALKNTKMKHGKCQPRSDHACTHCNAVDAIEKMLTEYRGAPVRLA